jgi:hypothetical protein
MMLNISAFGENRAIKGCTSVTSSKIRRARVPSAISHFGSKEGFGKTCITKQWSVTCAVLL